MSMMAQPTLTVQRPLVVTFLGKPRKCRTIFVETIETGIYKIVWCFSRSQSSVTPSRLNFEVKSKVDTSQTTMSAEWCQIKHDEIPIQSLTHMTLIQELRIPLNTSNLSIEVSVEIAECSESNGANQESIKVHWVELKRLCEKEVDNVKNIIVGPPATLLDTFNIIQKDRPNDLKLLSYDITPEGTRVATISRSGSKGFIDIWEPTMHQSDGTYERGAKQTEPTPVASTDFDLDSEISEGQTLGIAISHDGNQVVVYQQPDESRAWDDGFCEEELDRFIERFDQKEMSFFFKGYVYEYDAFKPPEDEDRPPKKLENSLKSAASILGFMGYGKFHKLPPVDRGILFTKGEPQDVFISTDGISVNVYSTQDDWEELYSIPISGLRSDINDKRSNCKELIDSITTS
ncbi:hypothetical protein BGX27_007461, partial [Mortierella sp. AM989]